MKPLNVYDSRNRDRLLGTFPRWSGPQVARCYQTLAYPPCAYVSNRVMPEIVMTNAVTMERAVKVSADGWEHEVCIVTSAPLEHLRMLPDFKVAGDTDEARARRMYAEALLVERYRSMMQLPYSYGEAVKRTAAEARRPPWWRGLPESRYCF